MEVPGIFEVKIKLGDMVKNFHIEENMEIVDMNFREFFTGLFNTDFLTEEELETICKAAEMYAEAKIKVHDKKLIK